MVTSKPLYRECLSRAFTVLVKLVHLGDDSALQLPEHLFAVTHSGACCITVLRPVRSGSVRRRRPIVDIGLRRPICCSASVAAVRKRSGEPLRMDNFFITPRDFSAEDDE